MARNFDLYLTGTPLPGHERSAAAEALAALVRVPAEKALELLAGTETLVKRSLDEIQASQYLAALKRAGVGARTAVSGPAPNSQTSPPGGATEPGASAPTITCPSCQRVQPKRNLCLDCGTNMPAMIAALESRTRAATRIADREKSAAERRRLLDKAADDDRPLYRRRPGRERLLALFGFPVWCAFVIVDSERTPMLRTLGAIGLALSAAAGVIVAAVLTA